MNRLTLTDQQVQEALINPYYAIDLDGRLFEPHPHTIDETSWIAANKQLLKELGSDAYLRLLLGVLKAKIHDDDDEHLGNKEMSSAALSQSWFRARRSAGSLSGG